MNEKSFVKDLFSWIKSLPYWKQYLSAKIFAEKTISESTIEQAFKYFLQEHSLSSDDISKINIDELLNENVIPESSDLEGIILSSIYDFKNISAIKDGQKIELNPQITILFGENGAGKTSYIRLLNNAFQSRGEKEILPNIYKDGEVLMPSCNFEFLNNAQVFNYRYPEDKDKKEFYLFTVFDSKSFRVHIDNKNELLFHPKDFEFFYLLIDGLHKVELKLEEEIRAKTKENPFVSFFYSDVETEVKEFIISLNTHSSIELLTQLSEFTDEDEIKKVELEKEKARLISQEVDKRIKEESALLNSLLSLKSDIGDILNSFSIESIAQLNIAINDLVAKKGLIEKSSIDQFNTLGLSGSSSIEWRNFIESAAVFSSKFFPGYPNTDEDRCVFCNQLLSNEAKMLVSSYWEYLNSIIEDEHKKIVTFIEGKKEEIRNLKFNQLGSNSILDLKLSLDKNEEKIANNWKSDLAALESIKDYVLNQLEISKVIEIRLETAIFIGIDDIISATQERIKRLKEEDPSETIVHISNEITLLSHKRILKSILSDVLSFLNDLKWIYKANSKSYEFNTSTATRKQRQLFEIYVSGNYLNQFIEECKILNAEFNVEITQEGKKGNTLRELKIKGHSLKQVLSEGEQRAISLADFLTEINLGNEAKGIILDDPVNSLDHKRKRTIAERFVIEAKKRQVVIFTHDLMFVSYLKAASEDQKIGFACHWVQKMADGAGQVYLNNSPANESDYKKAKTANEFYSRAKDSPPQEQEYLLKQGFGSLRTNYEAFVIFELFGEVVQRFNERISIGRLKDVVIDDEITRQVIEKTEFLSRYIEGHLHSDDYVFNKPTPELLLSEIKAYEDIKSRQRELKNKKSKVKE